MPLFYAAGAGANQTTSGTTNTEVNTLYGTAGATRPIAIDSLQVGGKANAATSISGISFRCKHWTTGTTGGSAITPKPRDPGYQAAVGTFGSGGTTGSGGGGLHFAVMCGKAGPGGWAATNPDDRPYIEAASGDSLDISNAAVEISLVYEASLSFCQ